MLPKNRTGEYAIWRACERFGILPSNVSKNWDDNNFWIQSKLIGYSQIRDIEEQERMHL